MDIVGKSSDAPLPRNWPSLICYIEVKNGSGAHMELIPLPLVIKFFEVYPSMNLYFDCADVNNYSYWLHKTLYIFGLLG
jgi:hypothetical protein